MKKTPIKLIFIILTVILILFFIRQQYQNEEMNTVSDKLEKFIGASYKNGNFNGTVLVADSGKIVFQKGYGMADYEKRIPNTVDTSFRIASVTKQFTAMCIMMLEEKGLLSVKDKISKYIPDYPSGDKISLHNLLTMSSGVTNNVTDVLGKYDTLSNTIALSIHKDENFTPTQLINIFKNNPLNFEPGEKFEYSNSNYVILGYIIEKVSNISYEDFVKNNIFIPLDMKNSGYDHNEVFPTKAIGYEKISPEQIKTFSYDMSIAYSCGGLYSTVEDLYKWDQALYTEKLVKKETTAKIFKPYTKITDVRMMGSLYYSYSYGWIVNVLAKETLAEHNGRLPGFISYIYHDENGKRTVIVLCNNDSFNAKFSEFCKEIVQIANSPGSIK